MLNHIPRFPIGFDVTYYPFSTQNTKDYENLLNVYLDATLYPLLSPIDFLQEGWRLEPEKLLEDPNSKLELKGVVLNEMKDVYANQMNVYALSLIQNILPDTIYKNDFGGHPFNIPELDSDQIKQFHRTHYHPSNSKFYTYGNQPLDFYLARIDAVLKRFDRNDDYKTLSQIHSQASWSDGRSLSIIGPADAFNTDLSKQNITSKSFLLADVNDSYENFVLSILSTLLTDGQNSPFYESLVNSGLGSDYSPGTGYLNWTKQSLFSVGLQGIKEENIPKVHEIIEKTLNDVRQNGFPKERIDAILHSIELESKHHTASFGLNLIRALNSTWNHDGDVVEAMSVNRNVDRFKQDLQNNPKFLQEKIEKYLIQNKHSLTLSMKPNPTYTDEFKQGLNKIRDSKVAGLSEEQRKRIVQDCLELNKLMNENSNVEVLPCLNVDQDIEKALPQPTKVENVQLLSNQVQVAAQSTNQLVYFRALSKINLSELSEELLPYLSIFCSLVTELAAGDLDRKQMSQQIELNTSGLSASTHVKHDLSSGDNCELYVLLHSYCLQEKLDKMLDLWEKFFNDLKLDGDEQHIQQLIKMNAANTSQAVVYSGHMYASLRSSHSINAVANLKEQLSGVEFVSKLNKIAQNEDVSVVIDKLKEIARIVFNRDNLRLALNAEPDQVSASLKNYERFLSNLSVQPNQTGRSAGSSVLSDFSAKRDLHEHYILQFNSNYVSKSLVGVPFGHSDYAKYKLLTNLLSRKYLHREIREKGSAYGSGLKMGLNGVLSFYSYRDPNLQKTLDVYDRSIDWLKEPNNFSDQDVNEAKLDLFKEIDSPITAGNHGMNLFLNDIDDRTLSNYRNNVFNIKKGDIVSLVLKDLVKSNRNFGVACLGPKSDETASSPWNHLNQQ